MALPLEGATRAPIIDLRSDTVTKPTPAMLDSMMRAELGDDVLGDDPTVIALQNKVAKLLGKEEALFVPSGTMANQIAIRTHTEPGDEIIAEAESHIFLYETGALGGICGLSVQLVHGEAGILNPTKIEAAIRPNDFHFPPTKLICIENTHNHGGGTDYPIERVKKIRALADKHGLRIHMDGARLWNACISSGLKPSDYAQYCDSVSVCLSKGLGAPVGSLIAGNKTFIQRAKRFRKMFGGAMRQSGILAAAGIYALDNNFERIKEDHANAKLLATELSKIPNIEIDLNEVQSNLVYFGIKGKKPEWLAERLKEEGIWVFAERPTQVRAVTHLHITKEAVLKTVQIIQTLT